MKSRAEVADGLARIGHADRVLELFGGTGRLTLYSMARGRWWNDADPALHRLAVMIRDDPGEIVRRVGDDPVRWGEIWDDRSSDRLGWPPEVVAVGAALTFAARMAGRAHLEQGTLRRWLRLLPETSALLRDVRLTCLDWRDALAAADGWAVYADPPYEGSISTSYATGGIDNAALASALERRSGQAVLCGSDVDGGEVSPVRKIRREVRVSHAGESHGVEMVRVFA